jgi:tetratricopeptide (TPR) repeat protein
MLRVRFIVFLIGALTLVSCSRDPKIVRQKYLESGNKYFAKGRYKEASITYRNAIRTDPKFGEAYYHEALVELKLSRIANAVPYLRRAIELLPADDSKTAAADYVDANVKLAEILLLAAQTSDPGDRNNKFLDEVRGIKDLLLKKDPNSFDGTKLNGELTLNDAIQLYKKNKPQESKEKMEEAIGVYRKALQL